MGRPTTGNLYLESIIRRRPARAGVATTPAVATLALTAHVPNRGIRA